MNLNKPRPLAAILEFSLIRKNNLSNNSHGLSAILERFLIRQNALISKPRPFSHLGQVPPIGSSCSGSGARKSRARQGGWAAMEHWGRGQRKRGVAGA